MQNRQQPRSKNPARFALAGMTMLASGGFMYAVLTGTTGEENADQVSAAAIAATTEGSVAGTGTDARTPNADSTPAARGSTTTDGETATAAPRNTATPRTVTTRRPRTRTRSS